MYHRSTQSTSARRTNTLPGVGLCVFALAIIGVAQPASAGFLQYASTVTILTGLMPAGSGVVGNSSSLVTITTPGAVDIVMSGLASNSPGDNIDATGSGSDIVFANIDVNNLTHLSELETISIPYTIHVLIDDYATFDSVGILGSATFDISGVLTGTIGKVGGGKQVNLSMNTYDPDNILTKVIGTMEYTLALNSYVPPGPTQTGAFGVHVTASPVPEPSTLALVGLGMIGLAIPAIRRSRRKARR